MKEGGVGVKIFIFLSAKLLYFSDLYISWPVSACSDKVLNCFAVRVVGNALQPQISVMNAVSNLI